MDYDFGLYVILTQPELKHTEIAEICVKKGIRYLQLREKNLDDRDLLQIAKDISSICRHSETRFIINDRVDIALLSGADGVHLGQEDISKKDAELLLGSNKIIGLSTHNVSQALNALKENPDYIGFGPLYPTPTKLKADPVTGLEPLNAVLESSRIYQIPVVAIGGIDLSNIHNILDFGVHNLALVRYLMNTRHFSERLDLITEKLKERT